MKAVRIEKSNGDGCYYVVQGKSRRKKGNNPRKEYEDYVGQGISVRGYVFYKKHRVIKYNPKTREETDYTDTLTRLGYSVDTLEEARLAWEAYTASKEAAVVTPSCPQAPINGIRYILNRDENQTSGLTAMAERGLKSVTFGSTFLLDELMRGTGYYDDVLAKTDCVPMDTLKALIAFRFGDGSAYSLAEKWYNKDISSYFFRSANLSSQSVSQALEALGDPTVGINFLFNHTQFLQKIYNTNNIKINIDSTPFDNNCAIYISRYYTHSNKVHIGFRLLVVVHIPTGLPVYFQILHGNIVDQSTLEYIKHTLSRFKYNITQIIADAGYFNLSSIEKLLFIENTDFTTRLNKNYVIFKNAIDNNLQNFCNDSDAFKYNGRIMHGKKLNIEINDKDTQKNETVFLYLFEDDKSKRTQMDNAEKSKDYAMKSCDEILKDRKKYGMFAIISTKELTFEEVLNEYFSRMNIEEYFDVLKNELDALPVRLHNIETIRGHILISFIASFFYILIKHRLSLFDCNYLNINPKYENDNILEPDPSNIKTDIIKQNVIDELVKTPFKDILYELKQHEAFVCTLEEPDKIYTDLIKEVVPSPVHRQAKIIYQAFGLLAPFRILVVKDRLDYVFDNNFPKGMTKELAFSDRPCKYDLDILNGKKDENGCENDTNENKDAGTNNQANTDSTDQPTDVKKRNQSTNIGENDKQTNIDTSNKATNTDSNTNNKSTNPGINDQSTDVNATNQSTNIGENDKQTNINTSNNATNRSDKTSNRRKSKDHLNQETLDKLFNKFDDFYDYWDGGWCKNQQGRPKGSLNRKTIHKLFNTFDNFFYYWDEGWCKKKRGRPKGSTK